MNREIKFRAWDPRAKAMEFTPNLELWWNEDGSLDFDEFTFMQYTGLKDKSGVEIYEGDILALEDPEDNSIQQVVFHNGKFQGYFIGGDDWPVYVDIWEEFIVIGNIYENPELLND